MTIDTDDLLNSILASLSRIDYVKPEDLPNIDLYMDQVTTFMEQQLESSKRYPEDKILTKTMINNYAKNQLLPPPVKKKYTKEHILMLIFIYYFKNILSINDIQEILNPITEKYFGNNKDFSLEDIYSEVFHLETAEVSNLQEDIARKYQTSQKTFEMTGLGNEEKEDLRTLAFICMLSFDVYVKKQLIEKLIDSKKAGARKPETKKAEARKPETKKTEARKSETRKP